MKKFLIVYYSRTGVSKKAAHKLQEILGSECDIEEIVDLKKRDGALGFAKSVKDALSNNITKINAVKLMPSEYEEVIIFTPIWAEKVSDAIRTYLSMYKSDIKALTLITCAKKSVGEGVKRDIFARFSIKVKRLISLMEKDVLEDNIDSYFDELKGGR